MSKSTRAEAKASEAKKENVAPQKHKTDISQFIGSPEEQILFLQRTIGNKAVGRLIKSGGALQAKLKIGHPGDIYEQEADLVSEQVMRIPQTHVSEETKVPENTAGNPIQRGCRDCKPEKENADEHIRAKGVSNSIPKVISELESSISAGGGQLLSESEQYDPGSLTGKELLANKLTQTIQHNSGVPELERFSLSDVIPDFILNPIKNLFGELSGFSSGMQSKAKGEAQAGQVRTDTIATQADSQVNAGITTQQSATNADTQSGQQRASQAQQQTAQTSAAGDAVTAGFNATAHIADYATDPVKPLLQGPPPVAASPAAAGAPHVAQQLAQGARPDATADWNCSESSIVSKVTPLGRNVVEGMIKAIKKVPGGAELLAWAEGKIARMKAIAARLQASVTAARDAVNKWVEAKLKPVKDAIAKAEKLVAQKWEAAKKTISDKAKTILKWSSEAWDRTRTTISNAVSGVIDWAKNGVTSLASKAKALAGRFWDSLPGRIKGPLEAGAAALVAPIALAYKAGEAAAEYAMKKAAEYKGKLQAMADRAVQWVSEKYKSVKETLSKVSDALSKAWDKLKKSAADKWKQAYDAVDKLTGNRLSAWRKAAAQKAAELKGEACAITGKTIGPCVDEFVPDPASGGTGFAEFSLKGNLTVPVEGVPVTVAAGASITVKRSAKTYTATISGEAAVGVKLEKSADSKEVSGEVSVEGTLPAKVAAIMHLGSGAGLGVPIPIGGDKKPPAAGGQPSGQQPAGGQKPSNVIDASGEAKVGVSEKLSASLTYTFDATADKTTCDGLGGLTAFVASQGAAAMLPQPFSNLAAGAGQAAFADKLTSASVTKAETGEIALEFKGGGAQGKLGASGEKGVTLAISKTPGTGNKVISVTLYRQLSGEASGEFAPEGVKLFKGAAGMAGQVQCQISYNVTSDELDAGLSQTLGVSLSLGAFPGFLNALPASVQDVIKSKMAGVPDANEGKVSVSMTSRMDHLRNLASRLDEVLSRGDSATAAQVWEAVKAYFANPDNVNVQLEVTLTLTENVLGVKGSIGDGEVSGGSEASITRGKEFTLYDQPFIK